MEGASIIDDRFVVLAQAAQGGMGSVYRARDRATGGTVAVKVLNLGGANDRVRFTREANLLAMLEHPHVVRYIAHGVTPDGQHYIVQEWVDGITLRTHVRTMGTTAAEAVVIARGLVDALRGAHALAIVHRDVKPDNVILAGARPDQVKLVDFGVARTTDTAVKLTRTGTVIGTPAYMSPEQARGLTDIGAATDVWATGCVLYEMLAGRQAFGGKSPMAVRAKVMLDSPPSLSALCPEAPQSLIVLVKSMLARAQEQRPTLDEIRAILGIMRIPEGPRRVVGAPLPVTKILTGADNTIEDTPRKNLSCFVFVSAMTPEDDTPQHEFLITDIAHRHDLDLHRLEDGSAVLSARSTGKPGAVAAARAALEVHDRLGVAVSVVGQADHEVDATLERGAQSLERATMGALFGDVVDGAARGIPIDQEIALIINDVIEVEMRDTGPVLADSLRTNRF